MTNPGGEGAGGRGTVEWAVIGGTGVYDPDLLEQPREQVITTPYGEALVTVGLYQGRPMAFLPRHGPGHKVPPHLINYRANIWALHHLGVERIIATNAVGSLREEMEPGHLVLCDQFLDFTHSRPATFFTGGEQGVVHIDVTEPYCPDIRRVMAAAGEELNLPIHRQGTYVCTQGPRFETPAEIGMFAAMGGHVVGMTSVPEVVLAREAGICYSSLCMVTNYAAGMAGQPLSHEEVLAILAQYEQRLRDLIMAVVPRLTGEPGCGCREVPAPMPGSRRGSGEGAPGGGSDSQEDDSHAG